MSHLESMMSFYRSELSDKIKKLSMSLDTTFGLDVFWYHVNTSDGHYSFAGNCPAVTEYYYGNDFHHDNPYLRHPKNYRNQAVLPLSAPTPEYLRSQLPTSEKFGMGQILLLMRREGSICHHFGFVSTKRNVAMDAVYLNHLPLLHKFSEYFLREWKPYRSKMERHTINLGEIIGPKYYEVSSSSPDLVTESQRQSFLREIRESQESSSRIETRSVYEKALDVIEQNLFSPLDYKILSKSVGASPSTLMRHFRNATNEPISSYVRRRRLDEAMKLLQLGRSSVGEVAFHVGYENLGAFSEAFRAQFNMAPSHFKKNLKSKRMT